MLTIYEQESATLKRLFREKSPISQSQFAKEYGLGTAGNLWHYLNGRRPLNARVATVIANGLGISVSDFSPRLAKEIAALQGGANVKLLDAEELARKKKQIPLISFVQAGSLTDVGDLIPDEYIEAFGDHPDGCFALKVSGDSMTPVFDDGDYVVIDPARCPKIGSYVVARSDMTGMSEATLKQYFEVDFDEDGRKIFELRPLNPMYPPMHSVKHKLHVIGVVAELIKRF